MKRKHGEGQSPSRQKENSGSSDEMPEPTRSLLPYVRPREHPDFCHHLHIANRYAADPKQQYEYVKPILVEHERIVDERFRSLEADPESKREMDAGDAVGLPDPNEVCLEKLYEIVFEYETSHRLGSTVVGPFRRFRGSPNTNEAELRLLIHWDGEPHKLPRLFDLLWENELIDGNSEEFAAHFDSPPQETLLRWLGSAMLLRKLFDALGEAGLASFETNFPNLILARHFRLKNGPINAKNLGAEYSKNKSTIPTKVNRIDVVHGIVAEIRGG